MRPLFLTLFVLLPCTIFAQVPQTLSYQGRLLRSDGSPESGVMNITFGFYADATSDVSLWSETQGVTLTDGFYAVNLGSVTPVPSTLFDGSDRYLQITIGGSALAPRQRVASAPYALMAGVAKSLAAGNASYIQNQTGTPQTGAFNIIGAAAIAGTGSISSAGTAVTGSGTDFTVLGEGDELIVGSQTRLVTAVASATSLTVNLAFSPALTASLFSYRKPIAQIQNSAGNSAVMVSSRGEVGLGTTTPAAKLDIQSTTQGFLPPRMTTLQRDAIVTPVAGLMIFNTTTAEMNFYNGTTWRSMVSGFSVRRVATVLQSNITLGGQTPTWDYPLANLPANTKAIVVGLYYVHGGSTNHGYLHFLAYQKGKAGAAADTTVYDEDHYDWYYNSDYMELLVPWDKSLNDDTLEVKVTSSYNTSSSNHYEIRLTGYITAN